MNNLPHLTSYMNGPPKFEVGLKPIDIDDWLKNDDQTHWIKDKANLLDNFRDDVYAAFDDSYEIQNELADLIGQHLQKEIAKDEPPLITASRHVSDDLIIMDKRDGEWKLIATTLCAPTFFDAKYALGKSLALLHGPIPTGAFDLTGRIARIFDNLAQDKVLERFNWTIQWSNERYTPNGGKLREMAMAADLGEAKKMLFERVERQTIRLLPKSGALVFTIRIRLSNLWHLIQTKNEFDAFKNAWQNAPEPVRQYKKWAPLERHVAYLLNYIDENKE